GGGCGAAARECESARAAFERGQRGLERAARRVAAARVVVLEWLAGLGLSKGAGHDDWGHHRAVHWVGLVARVNGEGLEGVGAVFRHPTSVPGRCAACTRTVSRRRLPSMCAQRRTGAPQKNKKPAESRRSSGLFVSGRRGRARLANASLIRRALALCLWPWPSWPARRRGPRRRSP